jgi:hypothetical protein
LKKLMANKKRLDEQKACFARVQAMLGRQESQGEAEEGGGEGTPANQASQEEGAKSLPFLLTCEEDMDPGSGEEAN